MPVVMSEPSHPTTRDRRANAVAQIPSRTMRLCFHEILVFGMVGDPGFDERADRDHLHALGPDLIKRAPNESWADALAAKLRGHLGMDETDHIALELVIGNSEMTIDHQLETMMRAVVDDITHERPLM